MAVETKYTYEAMFLADAAAAAGDNWERVLGAIDKIMQRAQAEVIRMDKWDERRLSYAVSGHKRGVYILSYFRARPEVIRSIERDVQLDETILRVLILRADRIPQEATRAPTPFMMSQQQKPKASEQSEPSKAPGEPDFEKGDNEDLDSESADGDDKEEAPPESNEDDQETIPDIIMEPLTEQKKEGDEKAKAQQDRLEEN